MEENFSVWFSILFKFLFSARFFISIESRKMHLTFSIDLWLTLRAWFLIRTEMTKYYILKFPHLLKIVIQSTILTIGSLIPNLSMLPVSCLISVHLTLIGVRIFMQSSPIKFSPILIQYIFIFSFTEPAAGAWFSPGSSSMHHWRIILIQGKGVHKYQYDIPECEPMEEWGCKNLHMMADYSCVSGVM